jgi:hypothetical protein
MTGSPPTSKPWNHQPTPSSDQLRWPKSGLVLAGTGLRLLLPASTTPPLAPWITLNLSCQPQVFYLGCLKIFLPQAGFSLEDLFSPSGTNS